MRTRKKKPSTPWCTNFILRFFYVFFLEICLCAFLQLSVVDFDEVSTTAQFWIAFTFTVIITALVIFVSSLIFCKGPQVAGFYTKGSAARSINEVRPRDSNFDSLEYLNSHPREIRNTPLLSKMVLLFNCAGVKKANLPEQSSDQKKNQIKDYTDDDKAMTERAFLATIASKQKLRRENNMVDRFGINTLDSQSLQPDN